MSGCVSLDWGVYPRASGPGVEPSGSCSAVGVCSATVSAPDVQAEVALKTYRPRLALVGLLLPVIPLYPFPILPWFVDADRLEVTVSLKGGTGSVRPDSLRLLLDGNEYAPASIQVGHSVSGPDQSLLASDRAWIAYDFKYLDSPRERFSISLDGLPTIDYAPDSDWRLLRWDEY